VPCGVASRVLIYVETNVKLSPTNYYKKYDGIIEPDEEDEEEDILMEDNETDYGSEVDFSGLATQADPLDTEDAGEY
jgi:hypothetical protein